VQEVSAHCFYVPYRLEVLVCIHFWRAILSILRAVTLQFAYRHWLHTLLFLLAAAVFSLCGEVELMKDVKKHLHISSLFFCSAVHLFISFMCFLSLSYHVMIYSMSA